MELKIRSLGSRYLLPILSFVCLGAAVIVAGLTLNFSPSRQTVLIAKSAIAEGQSITRELLTEQELAIGGVTQAYLTKFQPGLVALDSIAAGQLIPKQSLANQSEARFPIRFNNLPQISNAISVGDSVDIWATPADQSQAPQPVAFRAIVVSVEPSNSMGQATTSVELRIEPEYLESLLGVIDSNYKISLILNETLSDSK